MTDIVTTAELVNSSANATTNSDVLSIIMVLLCIAFLIAVPILLILFFVWLAMKKKAMWFGISAAICVVGAIVTATIAISTIVATTPPEEQKEPEQNIEESQKADSESEQLSEDTTTILEETTAEVTTAPHSHTYVETDCWYDFEIYSFDTTRDVQITKECTECGNVTTESRDISVEEMATYLKETCVSYDFEEIARYPSAHNGEYTVFTGEVIQVMESAGITILRVNITNTGNEYYSYYTDTIYVTYKFSDGLKVLEGDIITMWGKSTGEESYTAIFGQTITIPSFTAYYAELNQSNNSASVKPSNAFDESKVLSQLQVTTYTMDTLFSHYAFVEVTNNSEYDLKISVDLKYYNAAGNLVGADSRSENAIQSGTSVLFYTMPDEDFASIEYELSASEEDFYECVVNNLSYTSVTASNKEIVTITNNGTKPAKFVECYMLFFNGNQVVGFDHNYFTDEDSEIKPGQSITKELDCYESYDSYIIYFTGRANK